VSKIEFPSRSQTLKEALSAILTEIGFSISFRQLHENCTTIVVIDLDASKDQEIALTPQSHGAKVALAGEVHSLEISPDEIASLSGVLTCELSAAAFAQCLRLMAGGRSSARNTPPRASNADLSSHERDLLSLVMEGHPNSVIARCLGMTEALASVHLKSVLRKIGVDNRTQAAIWVLANLPELDSAARGFV
jgi:DNA-binding CsgD family transcriptional regulator